MGDFHTVASRIFETPVDTSLSRVKMLPMLPTVPEVPQLRIDPQWRCQKSGECCTQPPEVVMTKEEAAVLVHHAPLTVQMQFRPTGGNFVAMKAAPCPLYVFKTCLVYEHRPYNCRRFGCMRPDPKSEPFEVSGGNMLKRVSISKEAAKLARYMQRRAQEWARQYGWKVDHETVSDSGDSAPAPATLICTDRDSLPVR